MAIISSRSALLLAAVTDQESPRTTVDPPLPLSPLPLPLPPPAAGGPAAAAAAAAVDVDHRTHHQPPVVLVFENPTNGSTVGGDTLLHLSYTLRTARRAGRLLTDEEVQSLQEEDGVTMCFTVERPFQHPPVCAPLSTEIITVDRQLPGTWTTLTANLHASADTMVTADDDHDDDSEAAINRSETDAARGSHWDGAGDSVSVFVALEGLSSTAVSSPPPASMCGESICLDSSDMRSTYFDRVYR